LGDGNVLLFLPLPTSNSRFLLVDVVVSSELPKFSDGVVVGQIEWKSAFFVDGEVSGSCVCETSKANIPRSFRIDVLGIV